MEKTRQAAEVPGVHLVSCSKCTREYEIHGVASRLALALMAEGWEYDGVNFTCPRCPAVRDTPAYNKAREQARRVA